MVKSESQQEKVNKSIFAKIIYKKCIGCGKCLEVCEMNAIPDSYVGYIPISAEIDKVLCTGCGKCLQVCKYNAIFLTVL